MNRLFSKTLLGVHDIKHSRSKFGSKFMSLNYLHMQKNRLVSELVKIDMRQDVLRKRLANVEKEINERLHDFIILNR
ncbi:MAG: hypothetical protein AB1767_08740 [Bacillota bacterium]